MALATTTTRLLGEAAAIGERLRARARAPEGADPLAVLDHHRLLLDATARLSAAVAWLLLRRAVETGEIAAMPEEALVPLPPPPAPLACEPDAELAAALEAAAAFHARIARLAGGAQATGASG